MTNSSDPPIANKYFAQTLIKGLEEAKNSIVSLQKQSTATELELSNINLQLKSLTTSVDTLVKIVRGDGLSENSLVDRVKSAEVDIDKINDNLTYQNKLSSENNQGKWQIKIATLTGVFGMLTAIATAVISMLK